MTKLLIILIMAAALVDGLGASEREPPLMIDASHSAPLDAAD